MLSRGLGLVALLGLAVGATTGWAQDDETAAPAESATESAPAPAPAAKTEEPAAKAPAAANPRDGLLGPVRVGVTAAVGFPHPITYGIDALYQDTFSGGISFGSFTAKAATAEISISNWDLRGRWHPFSGSFFLGAAYGNQTIEAKVDDEIEVAGNKSSTHLKLEVETTYLTPHLGWFAMWDCGLTLGFELGYQMALSSKAKDLDVDFGGADPTGTDEFKKSQDDIKSGAEQFGKVSIPYLTLLRLGWLF